MMFRSRDVIVAVEAAYARQPDYYSMMTAHSWGFKPESTNHVIARGASIARHVSVMSCATEEIAIAN